MYLQFYGLKKQPFHITPDPEFLYLSPSHKEALAAIIYGIEERKGFITITGAVGVGKTTILRSYLDAAERKRLKIIYVFNAKLTFEGLVKTVYRELGLPIESNDVVEMVNRLYEVLIEEYKQNNTVVLVVDEAQNMPVDTLESLRMISNLETSQDKLIQIVLVGQPEFEEMLNLDRLRQLKQRIAVRSTIMPLTREEGLDYVRFRLQKAGSPAATVFSSSALRTIVRTARGIPRLINVLCDNSLVTGFGYQKKPVTKRVVREIMRDFARSKHSAFHRWWLPTTAAVMVALAGALWILSHQQALFGRLGGLVFPEQRQEQSAVRREEQSVVRQPEPVSQPAVRDDREQPTTGGKEQESGLSKSAPPGVTKKVAFGDTLSRLARDVYGNSSGGVMKLIRESNPQIADPDVIHPGTTVVFPSLPQQRRSTNRWTPRG